MPPQDLVQMLEKAKVQSVAEWQKPCHRLVDTARFVHDAVLSCCILTHLPPGRLSCMRSLQAPGSPLRCTQQDCKKAGCEGNRLYVDSTSPLRMRMNFPHHKNEHKWKRAVIAFEVPADLAELLQLYLEGPRKVLLEHHLLIEDTCDTVFFDKVGRTFSSSGFTLYWQDWLRSQGGPPLNPTICRQIFVTERQSDNPAPGPSDRGAAMIMGHSTRQWQDWYDCKFHSRLGQNAVNAMQMWRNAMLQGVDSSASGQPAATTCDDVPPGKRRRCVAHISESESDSEAEPASQPAVQGVALQQQQQQQSQPVQQPAVAVAPEAADVQAEVEDVMSEYLSCSSGSDDEIELLL